MTYKISYLSNGEKVKITNELFFQLKQWEMEGILLPIKFIDELKSQDNEWINSNRCYYTHNQQFECQHYPKSSFFNNSNHNSQITDIILTQEKLHQIYKVLLQCSGRQRRRFILYFYYGYSYSDIALQEGVNKSTIRQSIQKVREIIINMNIL